MNLKTSTPTPSIRKHKTDSLEALVGRAHVGGREVAGVGQLVYQVLTLALAGPAHHKVLRNMALELERLVSV